nr:reverse transcriptase domain-containing protein [Tanacetum cinerariifolium]
FDDLKSPNVDDETFDMDGDIRLIEIFLNNDISNDLPPPLPMYEIDETEKNKTSIEYPLNLKLKDLPLHFDYRTVAYPIGIAEDVFVQVGKFTFPANFVVVDYDVDPRVPLILGRPFLRTTHALGDVHGEVLTLQVGDEKLVFNVKSALKYPRKHGDEPIHKIDILDITCEDHFHEVLNVQNSINPMSGSPTPSFDPVVASLSPSLTPFGDSDFILEIDTFLAFDDLKSPNVDDETFDMDGDIRLIEIFLFTARDSILVIGVSLTLFPSLYVGDPVFFLTLMGELAFVGADMANLFVVRPSIEFPVSSPSFEYFSITEADLVHSRNSFQRDYILPGLLVVVSADVVSIAPYI